MKQINLEDKRSLVPDSGSATLAGNVSSPISMRCPHCSHVGTFEALHVGLNWTKAQKGASGTRSYLLGGVQRVCPNKQCRGIVFTVTAGETLIDSYPKERLGFDPEGLPQKLLQTLSEAVECNSVGAYRASAMMVRRILEEICEDAEANGKDLHSKLDSLRTKVILPNELFEAMKELKALGNDAAHVAAKNYSEVGKEESDISIELAKEILKARYQMKSLVERLRLKRRLPPE